MSSMEEMQEFLRGNGEGAFAEVTVSLCDRTVGHEIVKELSLADYEPDVRRVLAVRETVFPPATYVGGGRAEANGMVEYRLLCVTSEGSLCTVNASAEYEIALPLEEPTDGVSLSEEGCMLVMSETDSLSARLTAPRRIALRHRLSSHVRVYGTMTMEESFLGERPERIQRRIVEGEQMIADCALSEPIAFRDECPLPSGEGRVLSAESTVFVSSALPREESIAVSGEILIGLTVERDGVAEVIRRKLPFEGEIESEGFSTEGSVNATGVVENMTVTVGEGSIDIEGELLLSGRSQRRLPLRYTEDLYAVGCCTAAETETCRIPVAIKCENRNLSQNEKLPLSEARLPEGCEIVDVWGTARSESCERRGERYVHTGRSRYWILCRREGEYSVSELELPLRYETEAGEGELWAVDCAMQVISCRGRIDGDGALFHLDAEIAVAADYVGASSVTWVSAVRRGEETEKERAFLTVYYPTAEDSPWSVAKKYGIPQKDLSGDMDSYFVF